MDLQIGDIQKSYGTTWTYPILCRFVEKYIKIASVV